MLDYLRACVRIYTIPHISSFLSKSGRQALFIYIIHITYFGGKHKNGGISLDSPHFVSIEHGKWERFTRSRLYEASHHHLRSPGPFQSLLSTADKNGNSDMYPYLPTH